MEKPIKVLNLYAGIGGNRKLWEDVEVTAVELNPQIAAIYQDFFPNDKVIVGDAHEYLLAHYKEFDFIWSSPPCPTHSTVRKITSHQNAPLYPDMQLYQEILFLQGYFKGDWAVENVISWYEPLITPQTIGKHYFWANFFVTPFFEEVRHHKSSMAKMQAYKGVDLSTYVGIDKRKTVRNCVVPELGLHIFNCAKSQSRQLFEMAEMEQVSLFS